MSRWIPLLLLLACLAPPSHAAATPTFVFGHLCAPIGATATTYHCVYPGAQMTGTLAGNALAVACSTNNTNPTITVSDGGDSFSTAVTASGNQQVQWQFALNGAGGKTDFTITFSVGTTADQCGILEFANVLTAAALDGTSSGTGTAASVACSGAVGAAGDLILQMAVQDSGVTMTGWTHGSGFTAAFEDGAQGETNIGGFAVQYQVAAGAVTASITQAPGTNHFDTVCMALKPSASAQGTIPTGMRLVRIHDAGQNTTAGTPFNLQFPCTGNLMVLLPIAIPALTLGNTTDGNGNTWTALAASFSVSGAGTLRIYSAATPTCGADMTLSLAFTGSNAGGNTIVMVDVAGAASSPIDTGITCGASTLSSNVCEITATDSTAGAHTINTVTIVPSTSSGIVFAMVGVTNPGPTQGATPGIFACDWSPQEGSSGDNCENNGWAAQANAANTSRQFGFSFPATAGGAGTWAAMAAAFLAPAAASNFPQVFVIRPGDLL